MIIILNVLQVLREEVIIQECREGNKKSYEKLYKHFYGYAMGISLRYGHTREDAIEILNDSFLKVFDKIKSYVPEQPFKAWLRKIIVNTAIDHYRKNAKHLYQADLDEIRETVTEQASVISRLTADDILKLLDEIPPVHRMVFNLAEIEGYKHEEIAEILMIPNSSSRVYLARAKKQLRLLIEKNFFSEYERSIG